MTASGDPPLTYRDAGVDIKAADRLVEGIGPIAARTRRTGVIGSLGGFSGLFELSAERFQSPVLVSSTDGVGTKLILAHQMNSHDSIGIDLVAMCVNDVLTCGAEPLFFLDYLATGALEPVQAEAVISGIAEGCIQAGAALIGGETAEMPGMYHPGEYDLAGFCVGAVEKHRIIDGQSIVPGDLIIGIGSSGLHSNGYSLVRAVLSKSGVSLSDEFAGTTLGQRLLVPTRIYVKAILEVIRSIAVRGIAHITGGGIAGNLVRILPEGCQATLDQSNWPRPDILDWLQSAGNIDDEELLRTFNCGLGMLVIVAQEDGAKCQDILTRCGESNFLVGQIRSGPKDVVIN